MSNAQLKDEQNHALEQAKAQLESICEYVAALNCDYDRLEELRDEHKDLFEAAHDPESGTVDDLRALQEWDEENAEELAELESAAGDCENQEQAQERIYDDPLSVEVRSDWHSPGDKDSNKPSEFCILLCTGGPAVRIRGDLDEYGQPDRAYIQYQDWFTPWMDYVEHGHDDELLTYCQQFYFGE